MRNLEFFSTKFTFDQKLLTPHCHLPPNPSIEICLVKNFRVAAFPFAIAQSIKHFSAKVVTSKPSLFWPTLFKGVGTIMHRINRHPVDGRWQNKPLYPLDSDLSRDPSNNWSLNSTYVINWLNCQFDICNCLRALISFFQKFRAFLIKETVNALLLVFSGIWLSICF